MKDEDIVIRPFKPGAENLRTMFPSRWLKKEDIKGKGDLVVTIAETGRCDVRLPNGKLERDQVAIRFSGSPKVWLPGKTVIKALVATLGSEDPTTWIGRKIVIYHEPTVMYGTEQVGGIRTKPAPVDVKKDG